MMSIKILANDGIAIEGKQMLEAAGYFVNTEKVAQDKLPLVLPGYDAILVRSATEVRKSVIDQCPNLKLIGRGGVGLDNIDVDYARSKGIAVVNTPGASSQSVAELTFAHLFNGVRFLHDANRKMPEADASGFEGLKKAYSGGRELSGKTLGIIGFGRIGQAVARMAFGLGMGVKFADPLVAHADIEVRIGSQKIAIHLHPVSLDDLLKNADFITLHIPGKKGSPPLIGKAELEKMKKGSAIINTARGGVVDEIALLGSLNSGHIAFAGLDVFENEPQPSVELLKHPAISLSPHIGASTLEGQIRTSTELAQRVIEHFREK